MNVNASIIDFPIFSTLDRFFREFKAAGVDGVEVVSGVKTRFRFDYLEKLTKKYHLPITSMHQSVWSGTGIYFDERFFQRAEKLGVKTFAFHPLAFTRLDSNRMQRYCQRLSEMQLKYSIAVCLENMKDENAYKLLYAGGKNVRTHLKDLYDTAVKYGLYITYDTSHARFVDPPKEPSFEHLFPLIRNIHLSSFHQKKEHLPVTMGDFKAKEFVSYLINNKYNGLVTLEVYYPQMISLRNYDFSVIKDSVKLIKDIADKYE